MEKTVILNDVQAIKAAIALITCVEHSCDNCYLSLVDCDVTQQEVVEKLKAMVGDTGYPYEECREPRKDCGMRIKLDPGAIKPTRAHETDAGLDLYAREPEFVPAKGSAIFDTGVHVELPPGTVGFLKSKSGLNVKHGITGEGVIDVGYTGSIVVKLYNNSDYAYVVRAGDKISQLVILPIYTPELEVVDELEKTDRGDNGFGSTGR